MTNDLTYFCRCWSVTDKSGRILGYTDHDQELQFEDIVFRPSHGLNTSALTQSLGMSTDNAEAIGVLSDDGTSDAQVAAGLFDDAEVKTWLVDWRQVSNRTLEFCGYVSEITRENGVFRAEVASFASKLNKPIGRTYQTTCPAVLGDRTCGLDLDHPTFAFHCQGEWASLTEVSMSGVETYPEGWFTNGHLKITQGPFSGVIAHIKDDLRQGDLRVLKLWDPVQAIPEDISDIVIVAGCDKRFATCREKFDNILNFRAYSDLLTEDWFAVHPSQVSQKTGGSRR